MVVHSCFHQNDSCGITALVHGVRVRLHGKYLNVVHVLKTARFMFIMILS